MFGRRKELRAKLLALFGQDPTRNFRCEHTRNNLDKIRIYHDITKSDLGERKLDDITWTDLEMDEVFLRINQTKSYIGEQVLYRKMHDLNPQKNIKAYENVIQYLSKEEEKRLSLEEALDAIGKRRESYYLPELLQNSDMWKLQNPFLYHMLQILLFASFIFVVATGNPVSVCVAVAVAICNLSIYTFTKQKYEIYVHALGSVKNIILFCNMIVSKEEWKHLFGAEEIEESVKSFGKLSKFIGNFEVRKYGSMSGDPASVLVEYLYGMTLFDLSAFYHIMKIVSGKQEKLFFLYEFVGKIDAAVSVASYRASLSEFCQPEFSQERTIQVENLVHPLLQNPVGNDYVMERNALITGANASGKSTFMKAFAINVILAQTIHTCTASRMVLYPVQVMTSMALRDDIISGESYYIREIRYMKRMLDTVEAGYPVLCVIDEILKGTNTRERVAASEAILHYFSEKECRVLVATHDMELVQRLGNQYDLFYFESKMGENDISFDYKIKKGRGGNSNAIKLLEIMQFPERVVRQAKEFLE